MTSDAATLYITRHGETLWNVEGRLQGHLDSELSELGREQVRLLGVRVGELGPTVLYTSDLGRALATARAIAEASKLEPRLDARLRERHLGVFQGFTAAQIRLTHAHAWREFQKRDPDFVIPGGESARQRTQRTLAALRDIAERHPGQSIVVVGHGGTLDSIYRASTGLELGTRKSLVMANASLNTVDYRDGGWHLVSWGDTAHLSPSVAQ